jgi:hypothetical protein
VEGMWWGVLEKGECSTGDIQYRGDYRNTKYTDTDIDLDKVNNDEADVNFIEEYKAIIVNFIFLFGTTSNVIILIIIICNKDMRTVPNMYILNLVISDIIYLTVHFSDLYVNEIYDSLADVDFTSMCSFLQFCSNLSVGLSVYSVAVLSIQRYTVTVNPFLVHVSSKSTWRVTVASIFGVWILAAIFAVPSTFPRFLCGKDFLRELRYYKLLIIFDLIVFCVVPLCVIAFTYIMTARHLVENSRPLSEETQNPQLKTRRNTAKVLVGLTVVFSITCVPYYAAWTYFFWTPEINTPNYPFKYKDISPSTYGELLYKNLISTCFLLINPCINPLALFCTSSQFRQHLKRFCKTNSHPADIELARVN